jgi:hypothetical protein
MTLLFRFRGIGAISGEYEFGDEQQVRKRKGKNFREESIAERGVVEFRGTFAWPRERTAENLVMNEKEKKL